MKARAAWLPSAFLGLGALITVGINTQRSLPLTEPLDQAIPSEIDGFLAEDLPITDAEIRVAGVTDYLSRVYHSTDSTSATPWFTLYMGYYPNQTQGRTIHSPRNCLPGGGWEPLASREVEIETRAGPATVNRYLLQKGNQQALVLYWYQGRGRVAANEYKVKWNLLRDAAILRRTEEALVRIVVPVSNSESTAFATAARAAQNLIPAVSAALPG